MPIYVFDTNTLVSALLLEQSKPGQAFRRAFRDGEILMSAATVEELMDVLQREKFDRYVTKDEREEFLIALIDRARFLDPIEEIKICRDPTDNKFLELAAAADADYIVTGDRDLLELHRFRDTDIVTPTQFLEVGGE